MKITRSPPKKIKDRTMTCEKYQRQYDTCAKNKARPLKRLASKVELIEVLRDKDQETESSCKSSHQDWQRVMAVKGKEERQVKHLFQKSGQM